MHENIYFKITAQVVFSKRSPSDIILILSQSQSRPWTFELDKCICNDFYADLPQFGKKKMHENIFCQIMAPRSAFKAIVIMLEC